MFLVFFLLYCTHYLCVPLFLTYTTIIITITGCLILFSVLLTMEIFKPQPFCSNVSHQLTAVCFVLHFYSQRRPVTRMFLKQKVFVLTGNETETFDRKRASMLYMRPDLIRGMGRDIDKLIHNKWKITINAHYTLSSCKTFVGKARLAI